MSQSPQKINLAGIIFMELLHHPWRLLMFVLVILSAIAVILSTHHNRQLAIVHESLMQERDQLDVEWRHLILEQSVLTEHNRIETTVRKKLDMHRPLASDEVVVRLK